MKIALVTTEFVSRNRSSGGVANYLNRLSLGLAERGHRPIVVTAGERDGRAHRGGVRIETVAVGLSVAEIIVDRLTLWRFNQFLRMRRTGRNLAARLDEVMGHEPVDIVVYSHLGWIAAYRPPQVPGVILLASYTPWCRQAGGYSHHSRFAMWQQEIMERRVLKRADGVFGAGRAVVDAVAADLDRPVELIENPFFIEVENLDDSVMRDRLGCRPYLLFVGHLDTLKGVGTIAEILEPLLDQHPELLFAFAGREHCGYRGRPMEEHVLASSGAHRDRVIFLGELDHRRLFPLMERSTAVVLPSLTDNLPNVGIETMALGCVVIGTRRTGFEQLIIDGDSGILCEPGDPESLRAAIDRALALKPEARAAMGRSARSVVGRFHPDTTIPRHLEYFARIIGKVKGQRAADLALAVEPH